MFPQKGAVRVWEGLIWGSLIILVIAGGRLAYVHKGREWARNVVVVSLTVIIFSLLSDVLYIACTRWLLRAAAQCTHFAAIFLIICTDVVLAVALILLPIKVGAGITWLFPVAGVAIAISFVLNIVDVVACLAVVAFAALMLFHRFTWPVLEWIHPRPQIQACGHKKAAAEARLVDDWHQSGCRFPTCFGEGSWETRLKDVSHGPGQ